MVDADLRRSEEAMELHETFLDFLERQNFANGLKEVRRGGSRLV